MAMPYFPIYHNPSAPTAEGSAPITLKSKLSHRALSIAAAKQKAARNVKRLTKMPASSCTWYEAEDRTLPSVSSF